MMHTSPHASAVVLSASWWASPTSFPAQVILSIIEDLECQADKVTHCTALLKLLRSSAGWHDSQCVNCGNSSQHACDHEVKGMRLRSGYYASVLARSRNGTCCGTIDTGNIPQPLGSDTRSWPVWGPYAYFYTCTCIYLSKAIAYNTNSTQT